MSMAGRHFFHDATLRRRGVEVFRPPGNSVPPRIVGGRDVLGTVSGLREHTTLSAPQTDVLDRLLWQPLQHEAVHVAERNVCFHGRCDGQNDRVVARNARPKNGDATDASLLVPDFHSAAPSAESVSSTRPVPTFSWRALKKSTVTQMVSGGAGEVCLLVYRRAGRTTSSSDSIRGYGVGSTPPSGLQQRHRS